MRVHFTIDASGSVVEAGVQNSSGHDVLDRAAVDVIERAQPLPAPQPAAFGRRQFVIVAPIRFELR